MKPESLACQRELIAAKWLERALDSYPEETRRFFIQERDPFRNPVGSELRRGLPLLVDALLGGKDIKEVVPALESIVRMRAVQETDASRAASFLFTLGEIVRQVVDSGDDTDGSNRFLAELDGRIRDLVRMAEAMFMDCRGQIARLKDAEASRRSFVARRLAARKQVNGEHRQTKVNFD